MGKMSTFEELNRKQNTEKRPSSQKIKDFWLEYGEKVILAAGVILVAGISFEAGYLKGQKNQKEPVEVNQAACAPCPEKKYSANGAESADSKTNDAKTASTGENSGKSTAKKQSCAYVASKNSDKYHLASCQWASKIKPENKVCFSSVDEAQKRGLQPAKCCIK